MVIKSFNSQPPPREKNKIEDKSLIIRIFKYSAIKIRAKVPLLYSVLNPETNSDSPSEKSKGVRLVSAKIVQNQTINKGKHIKKTAIEKLLCSSQKSKFTKITKDPNIIKDILTSYEIVCAILRSAPRRAYFELEDHPEAKTL